MGKKVSENLPRGPNSFLVWLLTTLVIGAAASAATLRFFSDWNAAQTVFTMVTLLTSKFFEGALEKDLLLEKLNQKREEYDDKILSNSKNRMSFRNAWDKGQVYFTARAFSGDTDSFMSSVNQNNLFALGIGIIITFLYFMNWKPGAPGSSEFAISGYLIPVMFPFVIMWGPALFLAPRNRAINFS